MECGTGIIDKNDSLENEMNELKSIDDEDDPKKKAYLVINEFRKYYNNSWRRFQNTWIYVVSLFIFSVCFVQGRKYKDNSEFSIHYKISVAFCVCCFLILIVLGTIWFLKTYTYFMKTRNIPYLRMLEITISEYLKGANVDSKDKLIRHMENTVALKKILEKREN